MIDTGHVAAKILRHTRSQGQLSRKWDGDEHGRLFPKRERLQGKPTDGRPADGNTNKGGHAGTES